MSHTRKAFPPNGKILWQCVPVELKWEMLVCESVGVCVYDRVYVTCISMSDHNCIGCNSHFIFKSMQNIELYQTETCLPLDTTVWFIFFLCFCFWNTDTFSHFQFDFSFSISIVYQLSIILCFNVYTSRYAFANNYNNRTWTYWKWCAFFRVRVCCCCCCHRHRCCIRHTILVCSIHPHLVVLIVNLR